MKATVAKQNFDLFTELLKEHNGDLTPVCRGLDEMPYIMGLVHQSYERQMGNGGQP